GTVKPEFIVTPPTPVTVKGDVDRDGELTVRDATALQFWLAKLSTDDDLDLSVADYDGNGKINIVDVTKIQIDLAEI
ncbi:MAG: dockerin type I repeat-containing protein, partial [Oscillospiraceae bacterium]|nr:dockerin type I repeat-containing protein [Oscillospiraceae bacterium]